MEPFASSRSSTFSMSNCAYLASRTPSATFSKSQKTARLRASWLSGTMLHPHSFARVQPRLHALEVDVDDRRDVQGKHLRDDEAADDRKAEGLAYLATGPQAERDRKSADERRERGHHDRAEANDARLVDRLGRRLSLISLRLDCEVDHHDGVLLHDADQHDHADEAVDVEIEPEDQQRHDRAEHRERQPRENRDRVDVALVQHAEDDVDDEDGE